MINHEILKSIENVAPETARFLEKKWKELADEVEFMCVKAVDDENEESTEDELLPLIKLLMELAPSKQEAAELINVLFDNSLSDAYEVAYQEAIEKANSELEKRNAEILEESKATVAEFLEFLCKKDFLIADDVEELIKLGLWKKRKVVLIDSSAFIENPEKVIKYILAHGCSMKLGADSFAVVPDFCMKEIERILDNMDAETYKKIKLYIKIFKENVYVVNGSCQYPYATDKVFRNTRVVKFAATYAYLTEHGFEVKVLTKSEKVKQQISDVDEFQLK